MGLEDGVPVREDHRRPERAQVREDVERPCVQPVGERVAEEVAGRLEQARISIRPLPPLLHGTEIVAKAELDEPPLLDRPVALRELLAERLDEVRLQVVANPVVVEQCVVDVDEEGHRRCVGHRDILSHHPS